jgi:hypothetical protein
MIYDAAIAYTCYSIDYEASITYQDPGISLAPGTSSTGSSEYGHVTPETGTLLCRSQNLNKTFLIC